MVKDRKNQDYRLIGRANLLIGRIYVRLVITFYNLLLLIVKDFSIPWTETSFKRSTSKNTFSAVWLTVLILTDSAIAARACDIKPCTDALSRELSSRKATSAQNIATCLLLKEYSACLALLANSCHGDLIYLSLRRIAEKSMHADCPELMAKYERDNRLAVARRVAPPAPKTTGLTKADQEDVVGGGQPNGDVATGLKTNAGVMDGQRLNLPYTAYNGHHNKARCLFPYQRPTNHKKADRGPGRSPANRNSMRNGDQGRDGSWRAPWSPKSTAGYRYCVAFGDPHLRTFDGQHDTCRVLNAWPMVDNAYLTVQLFGERLNNGLNASAITKVSIIIKALPGCTDQKQYTAALSGDDDDFLPTAFDDGTVHSGEPSTSNGDTYAYHYNDGLDETLGVRVPPALFIEETLPTSGPVVVVDGGGDTRGQASPSASSRIDIHLRYVATRVIVRRTGHFLSVALKMPVEALAHESTLSAWQLCLASCPLHERIDYKRVLARPHEFAFKTSPVVDSDGVARRHEPHRSSASDEGYGRQETLENAEGQSLDRRGQSLDRRGQSIDNRRQSLEWRRQPMDRNASVEACRAARLTDFFFDACVFDLIVSGGDMSFRDAARFALDDIRRYYPPYVKHYQTSRADLAPYLAMYENEEELPVMDGVEGADHDRQTALPSVSNDVSTRDVKLPPSKGGAAVVRTSSLLCNGFVLITWLFRYYYTVNR